MPGSGQESVVGSSKSVCMVLMKEGEGRPNSGSMRVSQVDHDEDDEGRSKAAVKEMGRFVALCFS